MSDADHEMCPMRHLHADQVYGDRWQESSFSRPRLDGRSVGRTHRQTRCPGCGLYLVWTPRGAVAAVERVRALHPHDTELGACDYCEEMWPCPTIRALDGGDA